MTVAELKKELENIDGDVEVRIGDMAGHGEVAGILSFEDKICVMLDASCIVMRIRQ